MKTFFFPTARTIAGLVLTAVQSYGQSVYEPYTFVTIAGTSGASGRADGTGSAARFFGPSNMAVDGTGNLYVPDLGNNTIRRVSLVGTNWVVTTIAGKAGIVGSADGTNSAARFSRPSKVVLDNEGNLYVADNNNNTIRKITPVGTNWIVTTIAGKAGSVGSVDGTNSAARLNLAFGLALDSAGNLYATDYNNTIRKITPVGTNWVVTTIAGKPGIAGNADGTNSVARFNLADLNLTDDLAIDQAGSLYVTESASHTIRRVTPLGTNWIVTTIAGKPGTAGSTDGIGSAARFNDPGSLAVDGAGNIYVGDWGNATIRKVTPVGTNWLVTTLAGRAGSPGSNNGTGSAARFDYPSVAVDSAGNLYEVDFVSNYGMIRKSYPALAVRTSGPDFGFHGGQFGFDLTGPAGQLVIVEASSDLVSWLPIWTNTLANPLNPLNFNDPQSGVHSDRFYRAHTKQ